MQILNKNTHVALQTHKAKEEETTSLAPAALRSGSPRPAQYVNRKKSAMSNITKKTHSRSTCVRASCAGIAGLVGRAFTCVEGALRPGIMRIRITVSSEKINRFAYSGTKKNRSSKCGHIHINSFYSRATYKPVFFAVFMRRFAFCCLGCSERDEPVLSDSAVASCLGIVRIEGMSVAPRIG